LEDGVDERLLLREVRARRVHTCLLGKLDELLFRIQVEVLTRERELLDGAVKCIDVAFRFDPATHAWLPPFNAAHAITIGGDEPHVAPGALIGIEIEVSDPVKTAPSNAVKDLAANVDLVWIATLPDDREKTLRALRDHLPTDDWQQVVMIPLLQLLDALRQGRKEQS
jgi:hypothetical protein